MPKTIKFIKKKPTIYYQVTTCQIIDDQETIEYLEWFGTDEKEAYEEFNFYKKAELKEELYPSEDRLVYLNEAEGKDVDCNGQDFYEWECVECFSTKEYIQKIKVDCALPV